MISGVEIISGIRPPPTFDLLVWFRGRCAVQTVESQHDHNPGLLCSGQPNRLWQSCMPDHTNRSSHTERYDSQPQTPVLPSTQATHPRLYAQQSLELRTSTTTANLQRPVKSDSDSPVTVPLNHPILPRTTRHEHVPPAAAS